MKYTSGLVKVFFGAVILIAAVSCGRKLSPTRVTRSEASSPVVETLACPTPISGSLTRLSPAPGTPIVTGAVVQWQINLSGGCSNQYSLNGSTTVVGAQSIFERTYTQVGSTRETVRVVAVYTGSQLNPTPQTIQSEAFTVVAPTPEPVLPLRCQVSGELPSLTVPIDAAATIVAAPLPTVRFSVQLLRGTQAVSGRILSFQSLNIPALPLALPAGTSLSANDSLNGAAIPISFVFSKAGTQAISLAVSGGQNPVQTASCAFTFNIIGIVQAPPQIRSFSASLSTVVQGGSTVLSWSSSGNVSGCAITSAAVGFSRSVAANGSLEVTGITSARVYRLDCQQVSATPVTIQVYPRPESISLSFDSNDGGRNPNISGYVTGQPSPAIIFQDLLAPGGRDYGQFFYPGVEIQDYVSSLGIDPSRCPQSKIAEGQGALSIASIPYSRNYVNGNPNLPLGDVGVYAWGHGGATPQVVLHTNFRQISLRSTYQRGGGNQSPYLFTNGEKVVLGFRSLDRVNAYGATIRLEPGEYPTQFSSSVNVFDGAGLPAGLWKATCR